MKRTLIVTAHLDDVEFGMGGTLIDMCLRSAEEVKLLVFCQGRDDVNTIERLDAIAKIQNELGFQIVVLPNYDMTLEDLLMKDITKEIEEEIYSFNPERVFTVSENDIHQDHKIVSRATKIACRPNRTNVKELYEFKIPGCEPYSETYYDTSNDITNLHILKAGMCEHYSSEHIPNIERIEYFKTIFKKLEI